MKYVYLAGAMTGVPKEYYIGWRDYVGSELECQTLDPADYFDLESDTASGSLRFDMMAVRKSSAVFVNFDKNPNSVGTAMEISEALHDGIPIIGFVSENYLDQIHPWEKEACIKLFVGRDENDYSEMDDAIWFTGYSLL